jgi:hypothetical protein
VVSPVIGISAVGLAGAIDSLVVSSRLAVGSWTVSEGGVDAPVHPTNKVVTIREMLTRNMVAPLNF